VRRGRVGVRCRVAARGGAKIGGAALRLCLAVAGDADLRRLRPLILLVHTRFGQACDQGGGSVARRALPVRRSQLLCARLALRLALLLIFAAELSGALLLPPPPLDRGVRIAALARGAGAAGACAPAVVNARRGGTGGAAAGAWGGA